MTHHRPSESVWSYPRPPIVVPDDRFVEVEFAGVVVARTSRALRVLETSHPPTFYIPAADVAMESLVPSASRSFCEFKGIAAYWDLKVDHATSSDAAWSYPDPSTDFAALIDAIAFYPGRVDRCTVGGEEVLPQAGGFYGGWITCEIEGPFKGGHGTSSW
jgi:uncharacterized protein (DUF427 family)